jgi:hypothetical protein
LPAAEREKTPDFDRRQGKVNWIESGRRTPLTLWRSAAFSAGKLPERYSDQRIIR